MNGSAAGKAASERFFPPDALCGRGAGGLQPSRQGYSPFHEQGKSRAEIGSLQLCVMAYSSFRERGKS